MSHNSSLGGGRSAVKSARGRRAARLSTRVKNV